MIVMKDVYKKYPNGVTALNGISVRIDKGEFVYLVGASGAGKSTFIRLMFREIKATNGELFIDDENLNALPNKQVPFLRRNIGVVFQDFKLLPKLTAYENVAFALEVIEESPEKIRTRVMEVLELVGLKNKARSFPEELSGGEQQRVAIARAIVNHPKIVIADEPTGNLDYGTSNEIMKILEEINSRGTTVIMATHSQEIIKTFKKRIITIDSGIIVSDVPRGELSHEI